MQEEGKRPELRFKGNCKNWEESEASNLFISYSDKGHPELPVLSATQDAGMVKRDDAGINVYHDSENEKGYKRVLPGQFVIHLRSFQGGFAYSAIEGITSPAYTIFGFKEPEKHNDYFWKYIFNSKSFIKRLEMVTYGIRDGRSINYDEFLTLRFCFPCRSEQTEISSFITNLDKLITCQIHKYNQLVNMKQTFLEKMFPHDGAKAPEIRFDGFREDWTEEKLGRISNLLTGYPFESKYFSNSGIRLIRGVNVKRGHLDMSSGLCEYWPTSTGLDEYLLQQGDIVIQMDGAMIGRSYAMINNDDLPSLLVQRVTRVRTDKELSAYLYYCIQKGFLNYILGLKTETAVPHLSLKDISNYTIKIPRDEKEAICIGNFFQQMDKGITCLQQQIEQLKNIKQSFLDKMFVS